MFDKGRVLAGLAALGLCCALVPAAAQVAPAAPPAPPPGFMQSEPLGAGPWDFQTETGKVHAEVVARVARPWGMAFLPGGDILVTERDGRLRAIRKGKLDPVAIAGLPPINPAGIGGLFDIALDPDFASNRRLYLSYVKPDPANTDRTTLAVLSATWDGGLSLANVKDIFVADAWYGAQPLPARCCGQGPASGSHGGRILFGPDGKLYVTSGDRNYGEMVQKPDNHFGKILRLNPDGSVPTDNPFTGRRGWKPEIWTLGHRNPLGLTFHPETGELWETEFGPRGGDELNFISPGNNYGWIDVTQGHHYNDEPAKGVKEVEGMTDPVAAFGPPSLNPGNPAWYGGALFRGWQGDLLLPSFTKGVLRIDFSEGVPGDTEELLGDLKQRWRDARVAPDGSVYLLSDEVQGAVLRLTPGKD